MSKIQGLGIFLAQFLRDHEPYNIRHLRDLLKDLDALRRFVEESANEWDRNTRPIEEIFRRHVYRDIAALISPWRHAQETAQKELHAFLAFKSLGINAKDVSLHRFVPVRVCLSQAEDEQIEEVSEAINSFVSDFGFEVSHEFPAEEGSRWKRWYMRTKETTTGQKLSRILKDIEQALRLRFIELPQSEVNVNDARAISILVRATKDPASGSSRKMENGGSEYQDKNNKKIKNILRQGIPWSRP